MLLSNHPEYRNQKAGTVCAARYIGDGLTVRIMSSDETITINKGNKVVISFCGEAPFDKEVMLFGRHGNFRDKNGCYHNGSAYAKTSYFEVDDDVVFYDESKIINNLSLVGLTEEEIHYLSFSNTHAPIE